MKGDSAKAVAQLTAAEGIFALHGPKLDAATQTRLWNYLEVARRNNGIVQVSPQSTVNPEYMVQVVSGPEDGPTNGVQAHCIRHSASRPSHAN